MNVVVTPTVSWHSSNVIGQDARSSRQVVIAAGETVRGELTFVLKGAHFVKNEVVVAFLIVKNAAWRRSKLQFDIKPDTRSLDDRAKA